MDPLDFLKIANSLKNSREEAGRRSAVSRAYYAVFNYVRLYLVSKDVFVPDDGTAHEKIPRYLKNSGLQRAICVGQKMGELKIERRFMGFKVQGVLDIDHLMERGIKFGSSPIFKNRSRCHHLGSIRSVRSQTAPIK